MRYKFPDMGLERDRYLTIFEVIPNPAFVLDVENRIDNINNVAFEMFRDFLPTGFDYYGKVRLDEVLPWIREDLDAFVRGEALETSFEKDVETRGGADAGRQGHVPGQGARGGPDRRRRMSGRKEVLG